MKSLDKRVPGYGKFRSRWAQAVLKYPAAAVGLHWAFQSLFYMDPTERWFKISLDLLGTAILTILLKPFMGLWLALLFAFLTAHSLNFLFNGQIWGVLKQYGLVITPFDVFSTYVEQIVERAGQEPSISSVIVYGSISRQEWSQYSDLDARLIRKPGLLNGVHACWFLMQERTRALFARFPIDLYVIDRPTSLNKLRPDDTGIDLLTHGGMRFD